MGGKMVYARYASDDGGNYSLKTQRFNLFSTENQQWEIDPGTGSALKFDSWSSDDKIMPPGMKPRGIYIQHPTTGEVRFIPVGDVTSLAWTHAQTTFKIPIEGQADLETYNIVGTRGERPKRMAHDIFNVSPADQ